jgi:Mitochondrial protein Pet127
MTKDFTKLPAYRIASTDNNLITRARDVGAKFCSSTSSMTSLLAKFYMLLSREQAVQMQRFSPSIRAMAANFTYFTRSPTKASIKYKEGVYAIDGKIDGNVENHNVLMDYGRILEKLLTSEKSDFDRYLLQKSGDPSLAEQDTHESFHFAEIGSFVLRAQLDSRDPRLPRQIFDIKVNLA